MTTINKSYLKVHIEVEKALRSNSPIIGIDLSYILNKFSYPKNLEVFRNISDIIRKSNLVPASIAIIDGFIKIGLTSNEIEMLCIKTNIPTLDTEDLPFFILENKIGLTSLCSSIDLFNLINVSILFTGNLDKIPMNLSNPEIKDVILICSVNDNTIYSYDEFIKENFHQSSSCVINLFKDTYKHLNTVSDVNKLSKTLKVSKSISLVKNFIVINNDTSQNNGTLSMYSNAKIASELSIKYYDKFNN